jgi:hypothetical protein
MDEVDRLMELLSANNASSAAAKIPLLVSLDRVRDPRVVPFLLRLLSDESQQVEVRTQVVRLVRNGRLTPDERHRVAHQLIALLRQDSALALRLQVAYALGEFTDVPGVVAGLGNVALADGAIDLRYAAFTSLQRAQHVPECVGVLRQLVRDEALGPSARRVLSAWRLE